MTGLDLQVERVRRRLKQHRVAAVLGVHPSGLSHIEGTDDEIAPDVADRILAAISMAAGEVSNDQSAA